MKNVSARLVRESNPWGRRASRWYVEFHEPAGDLIGTTDVSPSRTGAMRDALAVSATNGWHLLEGN